MFYSQFILAKKGPLGTIWIAAHLERKLRKNQVADTDIGVSVDSILSPDVPIALRLSSHLLVGVVRIYSRKVNYLFDDCSEALLKVKQAFRSAAVDLPPEESKAPYHSITLPETFELDDFELPDNDIFHGNFVDHHISSRDQITLQDTLDGGTYSTSKFGLDERFGDGDASGLDLDEELLLEKVDAAGFAHERSDPQSSVGPMTPLKQDEHPEIRTVNSGTRVDDVDDYADPMEYAQAPCTPGLVEEPDLPNVQEVSACDDHMESEYHLGESAMMEKEKKNIYGDKQEVNWSSHDNKDSDGVPIVLPEKYGHHSDGLDVNFSKPQEEFPLEADMEHVPDSVGLGKSVDTTLEMADKIIGTSHVSCTEDLQNGVLPIDENDLHQYPHETGFVESGCEISGLASTGHQDEPQNSEIQVSNEPGDLSSLNLDVHEKVASSGTPFIRPCNSNMEQPDLISGHAMSADAAVQSAGIDLEASGREETVIIDKACSGADNLEEISKENHMQGDALQESIDAASKKPDSQVMNASTHDVVMDNLNNSAEANLPAPEKLLSVPEDIADQHNNMLAEMSPGEFVGLDASDAGSKVVSGKKRGFTESTLTDQSLNSVESSRLVRFKGTIESVPNDDDLLSSILVGRSSVLKVKSTPRPSEVASMKRARSAPRIGAPKRKVLMDDTMVLHGDMIRQQLTNSEDIRRVRKKAPCTRSEISLIQKKNLEDENFLEPLFTGMSKEFVPLHSQMWDLRGIQICKNDLNDSSLQNVADLRLSSENGKDASPETTTAPISCPDGTKNEDSPTTAAEPESTSHAENCENLDTGFAEASGRHNVAEQSGVKITNELLSDRDSEMAKPSESQPNADVDADVSRQEPLLDASGVEASDKNDFSSCPSADVVQTNAATETYETPTFVNADNLAGLSEQEKNAPSAAMDANNGQTSGGDILIARDGDGDGDFNDVFGTEPLVKDDIFVEVARESATIEILSDSKQGHLEFNGHNEMHSAILVENMEYPSYTAQQEDFTENGRSPERPEAHHDFMMGAESSGFNLHDQEEWMFSASGNDNDTDFLNVDDDELNEMDDDHIPEDEETKFIENTGWSSRTRAVTKYLQTLFIKEAEQGRKSLSLDNLLVGKSRKEASRMFFETLVLKTRDYIHVEQQTPFDGIAIKPRSALMKGGF